MKHLTIGVLLLVSLLVRGQEEDSAADLSKYSPNTLRAQFAGDIGAISLGASWNIWKGKFSLEPAVGYVPKLLGDSPMVIPSIKGFYHHKFGWNIKDRLRIKPLNAGVYGSYHLGSRFSRYTNSSNYPKGYYWWSVPIRYGFLLQPELLWVSKHERKPIAGLYLELSIDDLSLASLFGEDNFKYFGPRDLISLGAGLRVWLK